jgi:hypothetical protein
VLRRFFAIRLTSSEFFSLQKFFSFRFHFAGLTALPRACYR